eukprot:2649406-Alexandrium_andersonii.AAC.1
MRLEVASNMLVHVLGAGILTSVHAGPEGLIAWMGVRSHCAVREFVVLWLHVRLGSCAHVPSGRTA